MRGMSKAILLAVASAVMALPSVAAIALPSPAAEAADAPKSAPRSDQPRGSCGQQYASGQQTVTLTSGGLQRVLALYVPSTYDGHHRLPLVLTLHGSQSDAVEQLVRSEMPSNAERYGFVVASPQGYLPASPGFRWNVPGVTLRPGQPPDDEQFLSDAIDYLEANLCVDPRRVYGTGYSGGGRMISQYACDHADRLAAIAPVAGLRAGYPTTGPGGPVPDPATCTPTRPVPVIAFAGTADPVNPYPGGGAPYWQYGVPQALARWAEINGCRRGPVTTSVTAHVDRISYSACRRGASVLLYRVAGGGHTWPGSEAFIPLQSALGPVTFEIDATDLMWRFFRHHVLARWQH
jgi:polyhydroxybutyrate depolymerase